MRPSHFVATSWLALAGIASGACNGSPTVCTDELRIDLRPRGEQQIAVGTGFTATIALSSCGGRERLTDTFTWTSRDSVVARVDSATGRVAGRAPGSTAVDVRGARYGAVGSIPVTVR